MERKPPFLQQNFFLIKNPANPHEFQIFDGALGKGKRPFAFQKEGGWG